MLPELGLLLGQGLLKLRPDRLGELVLVGHQVPALDPVGHPGDEPQVVDVVLVVAYPALPAPLEDAPYAPACAAAYGEGVRGDDLGDLDGLVGDGVELIHLLQSHEARVAGEPVVLPQLLGGLLGDAV